MKKFLWLLIMAVVGTTVTLAQSVKTQTLVAAPQGVYISSYQEQDVVNIEGSESIYPRENLLNWQNAQGGNFAMRDWDDDDPAQVSGSVPATYWPQSLPTIFLTETIYNPTNVSQVLASYGYGTTSLSLLMEHCNISLYDPTLMTCTADTKVSLATGGTANSAQMNLWVINVTATNYFLPWTNYASAWYHSFASASIAPQNISILGQHPGSDNNLYVVLPDNTNLDVTPVITGINADNYAFNVTAQKYALTLTANGITLSNAVVATNANFCVGQNVPFALSLPAGVTATNYQWTLGGTYVNKLIPAPNTNSSDIYTNDPTLLTNPTLQTNWWISGGFNPPLTYKALVSCTLLFTNGNPPQPFSVQGLFTMQRPQVAMLNPAIHGMPTNIWATSTAYWVAFGSGTIALGVESTTNNMSYIVGITSSNFEGDAKITQICTINATGSGLNHCTNWLDNTDPYGLTAGGVGASVIVYKNTIVTNQFGPNTINLDDAPQAGSNYYQPISINDSFVDYVMFNPSYSGSIYVPLGEITWSTAGGVSWPSTTISSNSVVGPTNPDNSQNWPVWTNVYSNR